VLKIAVTGVTGRMGRILVQAINAHAGSEIILSAAIQRPSGSMLGSDAGELCGVGLLNVPIVASLDQAEFDLLIDFTLVEPCLQSLDYCRRNNKMMVIGTTGFDDQQKQTIKDASQDIGIVFAPNMSVGVNLSFHLLKKMSEVMGNDSDIEIIETHHRHKLDAPSGTALKLGEVIADTLGRDLQECAVYGREGVGAVRSGSEIGFATVRAGDVVGDHTVLFASEGERLELSHKASSRMTFANGALRAASWLKSQSAGLYDMQDVLGL